MELSDETVRKMFLDESRSASHCGFLAPIWVRRGHWVLLHGRYCVEGEWIIRIYDSLPTFSSGEADRVARSFFTNMHVEYRIETPQWYKQSRGSNDCALFVLRAAAAITRNVTIEKVRDILPRHALRKMLLSVPLRTTQAVSRMSDAEISLLNEAVAKHIQEELESTRSNLLAVPGRLVSGLRSIGKWMKETRSKTKPDGSESGKLQSLEQPLVGVHSSGEEGEAGPPRQHASPAPDDVQLNSTYCEFMDYMAAKGEEEPLPAAQTGASPPSVLQANTTTAGEHPAAAPHMNPFDLDNWDQL